MNPSISVIVPCYNGAAFIAQTIESVLRQTCPAFEVIVVDDGSSDDSAAIATGYSPRVRVIRQPNKGEAGARNTGIAAAKGSHLFFLDADDLIKEDALEQLSCAARANPEAMILMRSIRFEDDPARPVSEPSNPPGEFFPGIIDDCLGTPHAWLTPASVYRRTVGFIPTRNYFVDWEFWCQVALLNPPLVTLPYIGALYRNHAQSMSSTIHVAKRLRGHVAVMETLTSGMLSQPKLLDQFGGDLFWSSCVALERARAAKVPWTDLQRLERAIVEIARRQPASLRASTFPKAVRWLGFRLACWCRDAVGSRKRK